MKQIQYPYEIPGKPYQYVPLANKFMQEAMRYAKEESYDTGYGGNTPVGVVFVKNNKVVVGSGHGNDYHLNYGCKRKQLGIPSGQKYELCPGCDYSSHAEPKAIAKAIQYNISLDGADAYLFGQWWCCEPCSSKMVAAGIRNIYLLDDSEKYFNRDLSTFRNGDFKFFYNLIKTNGK